MSQIKVQDDLQSITNHPDFCIYRIICCYDGNKQKILFQFHVRSVRNRNLAFTANFKNRRFARTSVSAH